MFYDAFAIFVEFPWLALIPAAVFYLLYRRFRFKLVLTAAVLWLIYSLYEVGLWSRLLCGEDCNIRVDLLVIYPILAVASGIALLQLLWLVFRGRS